MLNLLAVFLLGSWPGCLAVNLPALHWRYQWELPWFTMPPCGSSQEPACVLVIKAGKLPEPVEPYSSCINRHFTLSLFFIFTAITIIKSSFWFMHSGHSYNIWKAKETIMNCLHFYPSCYRPKDTKVPLESCHPYQLPPRSHQTWYTPSYDGRPCAHNYSFVLTLSSSL